MFGNLIRECGVLQSLSDTAQNELANLINTAVGYHDFLQYEGQMHSYV